MARANTHNFDVTLEFETSAEKVKLVMPVWSPGHYLVEEYAKDISGVAAADAATGSQLEVTKVSKNTWNVSTGGAQKLRVTYSAYASSLDDTRSYLDGSMAIINGTSVFVYPEGMERTPIRVKLLAPESWKQVATGLEQVGHLEFAAPDYDILVDSPIQAGNQTLRSFFVRGVEHQVSIDGTPPIDIDTFVNDLKRIVEGTIPVFDHVPYKRYVFLIDFTDRGGGGLEHLNSTVCVAPRLNYVSKEEYDLSLSLYSHEFFHAWNVKRMRPKGLGPFDYSKETLTKSLWIAEGITSYYDDLILRRSGIYDVAEYLDALSLNFDTMKSLPGARVQSAQESSFDSWIKYYRADENYPNVGLSYYVQGAVVGWMLDLETLRATSAAKNLDDIMKKVYQETYLKEGRGYTDEEFEAAAVSVGGEGLREIFDSRVKGTKDVDYDRFLGYVGLSLAPKREHTKEEGFLGARLDGNSNVTTVMAGSPAERMGLAFEDEVLAVNGLRLNSERISYFVGSLKPGDSLNLTVARNGRLTELKGEAGQRPVFEYRIRPLKEADEGQKALFRSWLLAEWSPAIEYGGSGDHRPSPERRKTLDYV